MDPVPGLRPLSLQLPIAPARVTAANDRAVAPNLVNAAGDGREFAAMIGDAISDAAAKLRNAEAVSVASIKGGSSVQDVVEQVMAAEQALQSAIAVRDKIVSAYMEISRMSI